MTRVDLPGVGPARRSKLPSVLAGLVLGAAITALALPRSNGSSVASGTTGVPAGGTTVSGPVAQGGSVDQSSTGAAAGPSMATGSSGSSAPVAASGSSASPSAPAAGGAVPATAPGARPASASAGTPSSTQTATATSNGGATFRGVTADKIVVAALNFDSSTLGAACPRCSNGQVAKGAADNALVQAWRRDGQLPINGRDLDVVDFSYNAANQEEAKSACDSVAKLRPFVVVGTTAACDPKQYGFLAVQQYGFDQNALLQDRPLQWQVGPTANSVWANFPIFLNNEHLLKGQTLCMYSPADSVTAGVQEDLTSSFRTELHKLGYGLKVDITYGSAPNDAVAVEKFQSSGCTVALVMGFSLTEPAGFQNFAEQQHYRPKYPIAESASEMNDGVADVTYNSTAEDGNVGFAMEFASFSSRKPTVAAGNAAAEYCLKSYQDYVHRSLDAYNDYAEVVNALEACAPLQVVRQAIVNAGPDLTQDSFVAGMEKINGIQTADYFSASYGPDKQAGGDDWASAQFNKNRWPPADTYWGNFGPWTPFYLGPFGS